MSQVDQRGPEEGSLLFRSEDMQYVRLTMTKDAASDTMRELGDFALFHLVEMNDEEAAPTEGFLRNKRRVVECGQWLRKLQWLREEMEKNSIDAPGLETEAQPVRSGDVLQGLADYLAPLEEELNRNVEFRNRETSTLNSLIEREAVLRKLRGHIGVVDPEGFNEHQQTQEQRLKAAQHSMGRKDVEMGGLSMPLMSDDDGSSSGSRGGDDGKDGDEDSYARQRPQVRDGGGDRFHSYICGAMPVAQQGLFDRMLFRISRGNAYVRHVDLDGEIDDPATGEPQLKSAFYVVYIGNTLKSRITRICDFFHATVYDVPDSSSATERELNALSTAQNEKRQVLHETNRQIQLLLQGVARDGGTSPLRDWEEAVRRERITSDALKKCLMPNDSTMITVEGWCPSANVDELKLTVRTATRRSGAQPAVVQELMAPSQPPTYFRTNKFTGAFQGIVNTYGVPRYKEVNPGLFTIVTFPFLFGVMYGDMMHGTLLFCFGLGLVLGEKKLGDLKRAGKLGELPTMAYGGRYLLMLMGLCAMYAGTVYNDCASIPVDAFGTRWNYPPACTDKNCTDDDNTATWTTSVYPYGVDPAWSHTKNELTFFNSLKMKISVTLGVTQMTFGIALGLLNHLRNGDRISIIYEFVPQMIFMLSTFGYMIFMIVRKLTIEWPVAGINAIQSDRQPPNLINVMIKMFLSPGSVKKEEQLYPGQGMVQVVLVLLAVFSVPWMLFPKPYALRNQHRRRMAARGGGGGEHGELLQHDDDLDSADDDGHGGGGGHGHGGHFDFGEIFIHQAIHTIEFVLGCVSNTASYLRLWALSLAHSELSSVFWDKLIMEYGVKTGKGYMIFVTWGAWAGATFAVLLCMDTLESFLHALRLHWVEFQNKFFAADGYAFEAFTFERKEE